MLDILFWAFLGMMFAWFVCPDPPVWVTWGKNLVWGKVQEWISKE